MVADGFRLLPASLLRMWKEGAPKSFQRILKKICQSLMTDQPPPLLHTHLDNSLLEWKAWVLRPFGHSGGCLKPVCPRIPSACQQRDLPSKDGLSEQFAPAEFKPCIPIICNTFARP